MTAVDQALLDRLVPPTKEYSAAEVRDMFPGFVFARKTGKFKVYLFGYVAAYK